MPLRFAAAMLAVVGLLSIAPVSAPASAAPSLQHLIGQKLVVSMEGHTPSSSLLDRARRGRIGGVLIHGWNFSSSTQLRSIANELQQAAAQGGQPPLLIAVDQEGGQVKTVSWIPPTLSPPQMAWLLRSSCGPRWIVRPATYPSTIPKPGISTFCRSCLGAFRYASKGGRVRASDAWLRLGKPAAKAGVSSPRRRCLVKRRSCLRSAVPSGLSSIGRFSSERHREAAAAVRLRRNACARYSATASTGSRR